MLRIGSTNAAPAICCGGLPRSSPNPSPYNGGCPLSHAPKALRSNPINSAGFADKRSLQIAPGTSQLGRNRKTWIEQNTSAQPRRPDIRTRLSSRALANTTAPHPYFSGFFRWFSGETLVFTHGSVTNRLVVQILRLVPPRGPVRQLESTPFETFVKGSSTRFEPRCSGQDARRTRDARCRLHAFALPCRHDDKGQTAANDAPMRRR